MADRSDYLLADDAALLSQCDVDTYKASGPGGQHRNKVSSAVRLRHRLTGISAHGDDSRSQHDNKRLATRRLRMEIACRLRESVDPRADLPAVVRECLFTPKKAAPGGSRRLEVGVKDHRFWPVAAVLLDVLAHFDGSLADAAGHLGITTGNLAKLLRRERHLLTAAQGIRKRHGLGPLR